MTQSVKELLIEYSNRSNGNVVFEFINPNKDETTEQKAMQEGINPVMINVREKDQIKQQKAYIGAVLHYNEKKEIISEEGYFEDVFNIYGVNIYEITN